MSDRLLRGNGIDADDATGVRAVVVLVPGREPAVEAVEGLGPDAGPADGRDAVGGGGGGGIWP